MRPFFIERDHVSAYFIKKTCLVNGNVDGVVGCLEQDIASFWRFYPDREENRASTGGTDTEITVLLFDIVQNLGSDHDAGNAGRIKRVTGHCTGSIVKRW
jgi:hypothetical protein